MNNRQSTFQEFYEENQSKYNMDEQAWLLLYEAHEQKRAQQLQLEIEKLEQDKLLEEEQKKHSYEELIRQIWQCQNLKIKKSQLEKLRAGNLKDLRFYVEQQMAELTNKKSFIPRYKEVDILKERRQAEIEQEREPILEKQELKFRPPLKKKIDPNLVFVGLDKLAPRAIKINQYEFDVENYEPEDDINLQMEEELLNQIEEELRQGKRSQNQVTSNVRYPQKIIKKGDQVQQVQEKNQQLMEEKRRELLEKQQRDEQKVIQRKKEKIAQQKKKIISNFMRQQDKKENQNRQQLVDELHIEQLQEKIENKKQKVNKFQKQKSQYHKKKYELNCKLDEYDQNFNALLEQYQDGLVKADDLQNALQEIPVKINKSPKKQQQKVGPKKKLERQYINQKHQEDLINLEHKHNVELRMLIEREQLAELGRQKNQNEDMQELFRKQREAAQKRIQNTLTKQKMEVQNLQRIYSR